MHLRHSRHLELMLAAEVGVMKRMLEESGRGVVVATASGESMRAGSDLAADLAVDATRQLIESLRCEN